MGARQLGADGAPPPALAVCPAGQLCRQHTMDLSLPPVPGDRAQEAASSSVPLQAPGSLHNCLNGQRSGGPVCSRKQCSLNPQPGLREKRFAAGSSECMEMSIWVDAGDILI